MILRAGCLPLVPRPADQVADAGELLQVALSDAAGLTQFGVYIETLSPGARSSDRHWHEEEDEFLHVLTGTLTLVDNDGADTLHPGDSIGWPRGVANAHHVWNRSDAPCSYLIMGSRMPRDVVHYPDDGRTLYNDPQGWRLVDSAGRLLREGAS